MYVRVLFLLCAYLKINNADTDSDEAKYIDLLPEEEKQEFLNRITKRIVAEIRSGSRPDRTSVEISDERLNEHSAYVQKIMGEESETLKNNRRHERENKAENDENFEFKVKPLHDVEEQGNTDILDLPIVESKRRTRKDTYENSKQMSMEKGANHGDNVSAIPVNLLYDDENDLKKTVTEKTAVSKDEIKEEEDETLLEVEGLNTEKSVKEIQNSKDSENMGNKTEITDIKNKSMEIVSKEESEIHIIRKSNPFIDVNEEENVTDILQTITKDYETHDKAVPEVNEELIVKDTVESKSREITGKEIETDFPKITLQMPITELSEMNVESTTDNVFNIFSSGTEGDILNKSLSAENINEESTYVTESDYISTQNSTMTDLPPTLINENFLHTDKKNINDIINGTKQNVIKTAANENLEPATPSVDFRIELTTNESPVEGVNGDEFEFKNYSKNTGTGNNVKEDENINKVNTKPVLRKGSDHLEESRNENVHLKTSDILLPNGENNINHYHVFEISNKKPPFVPKEEVSFEVAEEPHYIPVYNYEPKNAFYTAYNHYGPNFNEHDKFKTKVSNQHGDDTFNNQNIERDYTNTGQRYFKPYITNNIYHRPRSIAYQSNLVPVWKDKFPVINFNPNDYLDVDYYLGRSNDASGHNDIGIKHKPQRINHKYVTSKDKSENIIDRDPSAEQQNVKENIKELRHKLFIQKYGNQAGARQTYDKYNLNLKDKLQGEEKNLDPILRGLDDTLLILLPEGESKHMKNYDFIDNNIAVDYYFSRMKSEELPLFNENNIKISDKVSNVDESKIVNFKKESEEHEQITDEKHVQIPLKHDHVLKINIGVKMGNKVDVIFRNVKKPERNKFEVYLKAYLDVLKDMIEHDNKGLMLYDWLGTTVDVQSAIRKLLDLIKCLQARDTIHYSDFELIKYVIHIFRSSNTLIKEDSEKSVKHTINRKQIPETNGSKRKMPRVINKIKTNIEKPIDTLKKVLKHVKEIQQLSIEIDDDVLVEFETFLTELQTSLYEIHGAIKQIATVTKFRKQSWFHDIKALYLTPVNRNALLRLLLHLASSKLFGLIEESAKNGLEDNFIIFAQNHRAEVDRTREEFIFVLRLLEELKNLKY